MPEYDSEGYERDLLGETVTEIESLGKQFARSGGGHLINQIRSLIDRWPGYVERSVLFMTVDKAIGHHLEFTDTGWKIYD